MALLLAMVCAALLWLIGSALWSIFVPKRRTWPPVKREGFVYRVNSLLGPAVSLGLPLVSILGWNSLELAPWLRFGVGGVLIGPGAYLALGGALRLGIDRSTGHEGELLESGPYRFSRNPQYVGSILSFLGLALFCNSAPGLATTALSSVWFLLLPFAEEPWLREKLGAPYEAYAARVPRYLPSVCRPDSD